MTFSAYPPSLLTALCPHTYSLSMYAVPPPAIDISMALTAEFLWLIETYLLAQMGYEGITVRWIMTIQAPHHASSVLEIERVWYYILMELD